MQRIASRLRLSLLMSCTLVVSSSCSSVSADAPTGPPATVTQVAAVLDLSKFPLFNATKEPQSRNVAGLSYNAKSDLKQAVDFQRKQLLKRGFKELPGGYSSDQTASGMFSKDGFRVTVTVFPASEPGEASVSILNLGNVQLDKLPVPPDAKPSFSGSSRNLVGQITVHPYSRFLRIHAATRGAHCRPLDPWLASSPIPAGFFC